MSRKRRHKSPPRPAAPPPPAGRRGPEGPPPALPPQARLRWEPSFDVRVFGAYLVAVLSMLPLGVAGFLEARTIGWMGAALAAVCVLAARGWRRRWGWRRAELRPSQRSRAWVALGVGAAALLGALRLFPPVTGARASLYLLAAGALAFAVLLLSKRAVWTEREFRQACRRLLREAPGAAASPRWKRRVRAVFYAYMAASWLAGLGYFYAVGLAVQGGAAAPEESRTERIQTDGRVAYVTPAEARRLGIIGLATTLNLPLLVGVGIILQVGLKVPVLGPPRAGRP